MYTPCLFLSLSFSPVGVVVFFPLAFSYPDLSLSFSTAFIPLTDLLPSFLRTPTFCATHDGHSIARGDSHGDSVR